MKRREFLTGTAAGAVAAAATLPAPAIAQGKIEWRMVTTWPKNSPGLGQAAQRYADKVNELSGGRLTIKVYAAGELVPPFESLDAVIRGGAEISHGAAYYWQGKSQALSFFTGVPYGLMAHEQAGWMHYMGGQQLYNEVYDQFGIQAYMAAQTGCQAGGWFRKEINSVADIKGLKFRPPGLGGQVWQRLGATVVNLPLGEIFAAMQSGALDAAEFVGPMNDLPFGFYQVAKNYYFPSVIEPGLALEVAINKSKLTELPKDLQAILRYAAQAEYEQSLADFTANNALALDVLVNKHGVQIKRFPEEVLVAAGNAAGELLTELRDKGDPMTKKVIESYVKARNTMKGYTKLTDLQYLQARELAFKYI